MVIVLSTRGPYPSPPMITDQLKQLAAARANVAELETVIAEVRKAELAALPARYGFADVDAFIAAVQAARRKLRAGKPIHTQPTGLPGRKRPRAKITHEIRAEVKKMTQAGKPGSAIAKALKISLPTVHNLRKALGLVKPRKK